MINLHPEDEDGSDMGYTLGDIERMRRTLRETDEVSPSLVGTSIELRRWDERHSQSALYSRENNPDIYFSDSSSNGGYDY